MGPDINPYYVDYINWNLDRRQVVSEFLVSQIEFSNTLQATPEESTACLLLGDWENTLTAVRTNSD